MTFNDDDFHFALVFTVGLIAVTLWLTVRYLAIVDARLDALAVEFYRPPHPVTVDA